ncbi:septation protein SepH [Microbacterium arabinogalactanolyticum]|uniref:septation protein SepH n=1 Tax=Microbacterium arabinogalactanolyticum TaxID=69365 RepID=UPI00255582B3|nr:septation protein SepH [Microbacterium arabinogalactanolyticum]GLC84286.1 DNA-binding protein [Microbacterium arabinogalactanolyticum]
MENVTIVGTEAGVLVLATESGQRFALPIDDVLHREVRRATRETEPAAARLAASPRDIQAQIRAGLSASEVAALLGVSEADVARFEGPVLAEREHIVGQALAVPVLIGSEVEPDAQPTFGVAVRAKLADLQASDERWASWKDDSGWTIKLEFTADEVEHDARWAFDPRRSTLSPLNPDATQLSRQGALPEGLIPRLRAVDHERVSPYKDDSRFDSGAFGPRLLPRPEEETADASPTEHSSAAVQAAAARRAPEESHPNAETADLLEALRRRRGQRESAPLFGEDEHDEPAPIALFDAIEDETPAEPEPAPEPEPSEQPSGRRKRRNAMPSWDEIVFGARTEE